MRRIFNGLRILLILSLPGCSLIDCAGGRRTTIAENPPNFEGTLLPSQASECKCPKANRYVLVNRGGAGKIEYRTVSREVADTAFTESSENIDALPNQQIKTQCSIQPSNATSECNRTVVTYIDGMAYGGEFNDLMTGIIGSYARADMEHMKNITALGNCPIKCKQENNCVSYDARTGGSVQLGREIALILGGVRNYIPNKTIVDLTAKKDNICQRSDVVFEGTTAYNVGLFEDCMVKAKMASDFGDIEISIPRTVSFEHYVKEGGNFSLSFIKDKASPQIEFSNEIFQKALGGVLVRIDYDTGSYIFETSSHNCFRVRVN